MLLLQWIRPFCTCHICGAEFKQSLRTRDHDHIVKALSSILHTDFMHGFDFQQFANLPNSSTFSGCKRGKIHLDDNLAHKGHRPTRSKSSSQALLKTQNFDLPKISVLVLFAADIHYVVPIDWRNLDVFGIQALQAVEAISLGSHQSSRPCYFLWAIWLVYVDFSGIRILGYNKKNYKLFWDFEYVNYVNVNIVIQN